MRRASRSSASSPATTGPRCATNSPRPGGPLAGVHGLPGDLDRDRDVPAGEPDRRCRHQQLPEGAGHRGPPFAWRRTPASDAFANSFENSMRSSTHARKNHLCRASRHPNRIHDSPRGSARHACHIANGSGAVSSSTTRSTVLTLQIEHTPVADAWACVRGACPHVFHAEDIAREGERYDERHVGGFPTLLVAHSVHFNAKRGGTPRAEMASGRTAPNRRQGTERVYAKRVLSETYGNRGQQYTRSTFLGGR
jgi:hypothetical protein